jgi:sigma-B regulation protein RsbU (phosphoserine phosphatase)
MMSSMNKRISKAMIIVVILALACEVSLFALAIYSFRNTMIDSNRQVGETTELKSSEQVTEITLSRILGMANGKADLADDIFKDFQGDVQIISNEASLIYANEDALSPREVPLPDAKKDGRLSIQLLYSEKADQESEEIIRETGLIGNAQETLLAINQNSDAMVSDYIATETGIMMQADYISSKKFDENGNILPYEAHERPWYKGAKETGKPFYTDISKDAHTTRKCIMCGVPIFSKNKLMGVAGAGMYLDNVEETVRSIDLGETGDACIINSGGKVLFSTRTEGTLVAEVDGKDLRTLEDTEIADMAKKAVDGEKNVLLINIDNNPYYVAYAPMKTVGWSFMILLSKDEVELPTKKLLENLNMVTEEAIVKTDIGIKSTTYLVALLILIIALVVPFVAFMVSDHIARPIKKLTERVRSIEGDNLEFEWTENTGDETQLLAESFKSLTYRIKNYIEDIKSITAEKERIGAELNVATQIQADMLPCIFPPYPDRDDFDIFASMTPAKEVGGDFYDFFLLDDDHLVMVMADVSGKGVPAALFMVISKTLIRDHIQLYGSPAKTLEMVNNLLCENNAEGMFVTVWLGILEISTGKIIASNAGHEYPAIRYGDGKFELFKDKHGFVVGGMEGLKFKDYEIELGDHGCIFLYTDGVPEATNASEELFGTDRMIEALNIDPMAEPKDLLKNVRGEVDGFVKEAPQFDDLTMLALIKRC